MKRKLSNNFWRFSPAILGAALVVAASGQVSATPATKPEAAKISPEIPQNATTTEVQSVQPATSSKPSAIPAVKPVSVTPANVIADNESVSPNDAVFQQIERYNSQPVDDDNMGQVTSVTQLADVKPTDWAYEAIRGLIERYSCTSGYPDGRFRGNRSLSRYEFAAGLNACIQKIQSLVPEKNSDVVLKEDLASIRQLIAQFGPELAILRANVDALQARTAELDLTQFSTTTKLNAEVIFGLTGIFTGDDIFGQKVDNVTILGNRTRLSLDTSFTGRDLLRTRLQASGLNTFNSRTQTNEGNLAFAADNANNSLQVDALLYKFPIGKSTEIVIAANGGRAYDFASTVNFLDGDGGSGALTRFGTRNPIYYLVEGSGLGLRQQLGKSLELSLGYLAGETNNPSNGAGLFNGAYGAMAQLLYKPNNRLQVGLTYINSYNRETLTGSPLSNPRTFINQLAKQPANVNFQPASAPATPIVFPANQPIPAGTQLPAGSQLPAGTTLVGATTLPFPVTISRAPLPGNITIPAGTRVPAGARLPSAITLPVDFPLLAPITLPVDFTLPGATTPPLPPIVFNGTVGDLLKQPDFAGIPLGFDVDIPIASNSYGLQVSWMASDRFVLGGWVGYTQTRNLTTGNGLFSRGTIDSINGAITLAFPNLGKKGNLGGIIVGVEPLVLNTDIKVNQNLVNPSSLNPSLIPAGLALFNSAPALQQLVNGFRNVDPNVSLHVEAFYQMQLTDNIAVTPGVVWITAPGYNANNAGLLIGTIRTTFRF